MKRVKYKLSDKKLWHHKQNGKRTLKNALCDIQKMMSRKKYELYCQKQSALLHENFRTLSGNCYQSILSTVLLMFTVKDLRKKPSDHLIVNKLLHSYLNPFFFS